jgi:trk system potassium uptake protein TrkA
MQSVVVDSILSHLIGGGVKRVRQVGDSSVGILEIEISPGALAADKVLSGFRLPAGALVMLVNRGETSFIPRGDYVFKAGDRIALTAKTGNDEEIKRLFGVPQ